MTIFINGEKKHYSRISKWADIVLVDSNLGKESIL